METTSSTTHRPPRRLARRILLALGASLAALVVTVAALSQTAAFRDWLRSQVIAQANAALKGRVEIGALDGNLFGYFVLTDLRVTLDGERILSVGRARAAYRLLPLIRDRRLVIEEITFDDVYGRLVNDAKGWNVARLLPESKEPDTPKEAGELWPISLEALAIEQGAIEVLTDGETYALRDIALHASAEVSREARNLRLKSLSFRMPERRLELSKLAADVSMASDGSLTAENLVIETAASHASGYARRQAGAQLHYDADIEMELSAAEIGRVVERDLTTDVHGRLRLLGPAQALSVDGTAIESQAGNVSLQGTLNLEDEGYDLQLRAERLDPIELVGRDGARSAIDVVVQISGMGYSLDEAQLSAAIHIEPSELHGAQVRTVDGKLTVGDQQIVIQNLNVDSTFAQATVSGSVGLNETKPSAESATALRYNVVVSDLAALAKLAGVGPARGRVTLEGSAAGSLQALAVNAEITGREIAYGTSTIGIFTAVAKGANLGATNAALSVESEAKELLLGGHQLATLNLDAKWEKRGNAAAEAFVEAKATEPDERHHLLRATASLGANEETVRLGALRLDLPEHTWTLGRPAEITHRDGVVRIPDFEMRSDAGTVVVKGQAGASGAQDLEVLLDDLDLATLLGEQERTVSGTVAARAHLGGTAKRPKVEAHVTVDRPAMESITYETAVLDLSAGDGEAVLQARLVQQEAQARRLLLDARAPLHLSLSPFKAEIGESLSGALRSTAIDLAFLDPLLRDVDDLAGVFTADLVIEGSPRDPQIRGPLAVEGARAHVLPSGLHYDPIELSAEIDGRTLRVARAHVASGGGTVTGSGWLSASREAELTFDIDDFPVFDNRLGEAEISGQVRLSGSLATPVAEGRIQVERMVLKMPEQMPGSIRPPDPTIMVLGPHQPAMVANNEVVDSAADAPEVTREQPDPYEQASIRIDVNVPHNAWLRRSDTNIELRGAITVSKHPHQELSIAGEIATVRGWYTFQGKKFKVVEGEIRFSGQDFNPYLHVIAAHQTGEYTVRAIIGGTVRQPSLKLESDPWLEQADVLSVLLFGRPVSKLTQGEERGLQERALGVASTYAASEFRQSVADALGVDNLEIEPGSEGLGDTAVSVGKYLSEDVFVSLSHKFAEQNVEQLRIEYFFTPHWTLQTTTDTLGDSGLDLFWNWRY